MQDFKLSNLQHIKRESGIYALKKDKEIVYVGQSINVQTRILEHIVEKSKDFDEINAIYNDNILNVQTMEVVIIGILKPKYNKLIIDEQLFLKVLPQDIKQKLGITDIDKYINESIQLINKLKSFKNEI